MSIEIKVALIGALSGIVAAVLALLVNRYFFVKDDKKKAILNLSTADIDSRDKFQDRLLKRIKDLEDEQKVQRKNSEDRERRISELEKEAEKCAMTLATVMEQNQGLATLRRYFERELKHSEILRAAYDSSLLPIVMADCNGDIVTWNPAATKLFGYQEWEVIGRPIAMIMPEQYRRRHEEGFRRAKETGLFRMMGKAFNMRGLRKDGTEIPITLRLQTWKVDGDNYFSATIFAPEDEQVTEAP